MADDSETRFCTNCKRDIAAANFVMHEVHCRRNIVLCKKCGEPYPKSELERHIEEEHTEISCDKCFKKFENGLLEAHQANDCPKRIVKCPYCEIDIARDELDEHSGYCGSRTEQCVKCERFIMLKDQQCHEDSNCTYPEQKSNSSQNGVSYRPAAPNRLNSFVFNELSRMADGPIPRIHNDFRGLSQEPDDLEVAQPRRRPAVQHAASTSRSNVAKVDRNSNSTNRKTVNVFKNNTPAVRNESRITGSSASNPMRSQPALNRKTGPFTSTNKSGNSQKNGPSSAGRRGVNESDYSDAAASSSVVDQLMEMPENLYSSMTDEDIAEYLGQFPDEGDSMFASHKTEDNGASSMPSVPFIDYNRDLTVLPCEFCGVTFPAHELVLHETGCDAAVNSNDDIPNNEGALEDDLDFGLSAQGNKGEPHILDNLGYMAAQDFYSRPVPHGFTDDEEAMLPCEFCEELFPLDSLVVHQAVCESNLTQTPRVRSPDVPNPRRRQGYSNLSTSPVLSRARSHQPDFGLCDDSDSDDSPSDDSPSRATTNESRASYASNYSGNRQSVYPNASKNSSVFGTRNRPPQGPGSRKTNETSHQKSNARAKATLYDLVHNPAPKTYNMSRTTTENRRERSTAFRPSKDTGVGTSISTRRTVNTNSTSSRANSSRNGQHADSETSGYEASFAQPKPDTSKRGTRPIPKSNVGSDLGSLNGMRVGEPRNQRTGLKGIQTKKNDLSRR